MVPNFQSRSLEDASDQAHLDLEPLLFNDSSRGSQKPKDQAENSSNEDRGFEPSLASSRLKVRRPPFKGPSQACPSIGWGLQGRIEGKDRRRGDSVFRIIGQEILGLSSNLCTGLVQDILHRTPRRRL